MKLIYYKISPENLLELYFGNGGKILIRLDENSGRIMKRPKIASLLNVQHTGIRLGTDYYTGEVYVIHNHFQFGAAYITTFTEFAARQQVSWNGGCTNPPLNVISTGLDYVIAGKRYDVLAYNCQTLTNTACHSKPVSEDVNRIAGGALLGFLLVGLAVAVAGSD